MDSLKILNLLGVDLILKNGDRLLSSGYVREPDKLLDKPVLHKSQFAIVNGYRFCKESLGRLPEPESGTMFVVFKSIKKALSNRNDLLCREDLN